MCSVRTQHCLKNDLDLLEYHGMAIPVPWYNGIMAHVYVLLHVCQLPYNAVPSDNTLCGQAPRFRLLSSSTAATTDQPLNGKTTLWTIMVWFVLEYQYGTRVQT